MFNHIYLKRIVLIKSFLLVVITITGLSVNAQDLNNLDSLLIDRDLKNYSVRLFTNYKANKFNVKDVDSRVQFVPNNRHGIGFGVANKKLIIDIAFNLKNRNKEETRRFDVQGTTILKNRHFVSAFFQTYKGFTSKNNFDEPTIFRDDMRAVRLGFNYLFTLDGVEFSYALLKAGLEKKRHKKIVISGGVGAFGIFDYFSAKQGILFENGNNFFNEEANIRRYKGTAVGVLGGFVSYFKLPGNITTTLNITPGIGVMNKKIELQDGSYKPSNPLLYKFEFLIGLGYSYNQFYTVLTYDSSFYSTDFDNNNSYRLNLTNAKLAIGYRLKRQKK